MMEPATIEELRARSSSGDHTGEDWECLSAGSDHSPNLPGGRQEHAEGTDHHEVSLPSDDGSQPSASSRVSPYPSGRLFSHAEIMKNAELSCALSGKTSPPTPFCSRASLHPEATSSRASSEAPEASAAPQSPGSTPTTPKIGTPKIKLVESDRYQKILVVGQEGLGKTTFIRTLAAAYGAQVHVAEPTSLDLFAEDPEALCTHIRILDEDSKITYNHMIQDTPGECAGEARDLLMDYIGANIDKHFHLEEDPSREDTMSRHEDLRVDVCLYFVGPHAFTRSDRDTIKELSKRVPVIPILSKADCMTTDELSAFRETVMEALRDLSKETNRAVWPSFSDEDLLGAGAPPSQVFAVIGSTHIDVCENKFWPVRVYPWGRAEAMSSVHSDLPSLTQLLFELAPETLKAATEARYYHLRRLMLQAGGSTSSLECDMGPEPPLQVPPQTSTLSSSSSSSAQGPHRSSVPPRPKAPGARVAAPRPARGGRSPARWGIMGWLSCLILLGFAATWVLSISRCIATRYRADTVQRELFYATSRWEQQMGQPGSEPGSILISPATREVLEVLLKQGQEVGCKGRKVPIWRDTAAKVLVALKAAPEVQGPAAKEQTAPPSCAVQSCSEGFEPVHAGPEKYRPPKQAPTGWLHEKLTKLEKVASLEKATSPAKASKLEKRMAKLAVKLSAQKDRLMRKFGKALESPRAQKLLRRASLLAAWL